MVGEKYLLDFTGSYYAKGIRDQKHLTWCTMEIVNEVQQLDKNTEITPATWIRAFYYIKEEIYMLTLMVERVEDVILSIFI
jgi:hypothetical protein